jgi:hypothetical protein
MGRTPRDFRAECFELEGRLLLSNVPASRPAHVRVLVPPSVGFQGTPLPGTTNLSQVVTQQDGEATVTLSGYVQPGTGSLQVVVATDPSSPAVGVNVGAVDQTITFANGNSQATVTVPILAGASNPGEVDVDLTITPIDPPPKLTTSGPLELRILSSADMIPPKIVSVKGAPHGIVLTFSKSMDPLGASNVNNYTVRATTTSTKTDPFLVPIDFLTFPLHMDSSISTSYSESTRNVPLRAAQYDPATNSVTLVTKRKLNYSASISVFQGNQTKVSGPPGLQSNFGPGLTDLEGNLINGDTSPGQFDIPVLRGTHATP